MIYSDELSVLVFMPLREGDSPAAYKKLLDDAYRYIACGSAYDVDIRVFRAIRGDVLHFHHHANMNFVHTESSRQKVARIEELARAWHTAYLLRG